MFKNPISPKKGTKEPKNPWNFEAPKYDDRNLLSAGTNYGSGFLNPVGTEKVSTNSPVPMGCRRVDIDEKKGY